MKKLFVPADKTSSFYKLNTVEYLKLVDKAVEKEYKCAEDDTRRSVNIMDKRIASSLGIEDRVDSIPGNECFVTLKDHKPDFQNKPSVRLLNPNKSNIGKVSKQKLAIINTKVREHLGVQQW